MSGDNNTPLRITKAWVNASAEIAAIPIIASGVVFLALDKSEHALIAAGIGFALVVATRLRDIVEISVGPLKASLRDAISDAKASTAELRAVAVALGAAQINSLISSAFFANMHWRERLRVYDELIAGLRKAGVPEHEITAASVPWRKGISWAYADWKIGRLVMREQGNEVRDAYNALSTFAIREAATPSQIRKFLQSHNIAVPEADAFLSDYEHFLETGVIRRPEKFYEGLD